MSQRAALRPAVCAGRRQPLRHALLLPPPPGCREEKCVRSYRSNHSSSLRIVSWLLLYHIISYHISVFGLSAFIVSLHFIHSPFHHFIPLSFFTVFFNYAVWFCLILLHHRLSILVRNIFLGRSKTGQGGEGADAEATTDQAAVAADRSRPDALTAERVEDLVSDYLRQRQGMEILTERHMATAVREFVEKEEKDAIQR